jgi:hypothetical protein
VKYRKKPVVIEAVQWNCDIESESEITKMGLVCLGMGTLSSLLIIPTLEGQHVATIGDYIIKGVKGEFYPCKPDIFEMTYEPVEETDKTEGE